jgi:nitroreductase
MKSKTLLFAAVFVVVGVSIYAQQAGRPAIDVITQNFAASRWAGGQIPAADIDRIANAAVRAPSASNKQPWKVTGVQTKSLADRIISGMPEGSVLFVVSSVGNADENNKLYLDCGLATENIYLAAQALGYGSRIYTGPVRNIGADVKAALGVTGSNSVVAIVRVGRLAAGVDAVTSASPRKPARDVVIYK